MRPYSHLITVAIFLAQAVLAVCAFAQGGRAAAIRREKDKDFLVIILISDSSEAQPGRLDSVSTLIASKGNGCN